MENMKNSDFNWELQNGKTLSQNTGPQFDHTLANADGQFLFIEGSAPAQSGYKALLQSSLFSATASYGTCFEFWYHMYGRDIGTLNIYAHVTESNDTILLWTQSGNKGDQWLYGRVNIKTSKSFRLIVEGIRGPGYLSDIACK